MRVRLETIRRSPVLRFTVLLVAYAAVVAGSHWLAFELRFDFDIPARWGTVLATNWPLETLTYLILLYAFGQFSGLLSYFSVPDLKRVVYATGLASLILFVVRYLPISYPASPRSVLLLAFLLSTIGIGCIRLGLRLARERSRGPSDGHFARARRVGIIGAGDVGANLARELLAKRGLAMQPVAFFDDDSAKWGSELHGIPIVGAPEVLVKRQGAIEIEEAIIAIPSASAKRMGEIVALLQAARIKFETVPSLTQLAVGKVRVSKLRSVEIQDLLGRQPVPLATDNIRHLLQGKVVAVTGAGGSIGSELCRQILGFDPRRILLVEQAEGLLFQTQQELLEFGGDSTLTPLVADIVDAGRMRQIIERHRPEIVFHAAAHKHVPLMESQPGEAIHNNTVGSARLAELALACGVGRFVLISTDKAINPTNVMGATKRLAEIFVQALHAAHPGQTKFMAVRFGNVLGSSGSVVPTFDRQIVAGGPVTVTHPEVTRYFMTVPEAAGLVLQSAAQGDGGEIFILDMGKPVRIVDLARQMIELHGLRPDEDIQIKFIGLRPGEKLFEELSYQGENYTPTQHPKIMRFHSRSAPLGEVRQTLAELTAHLHTADAHQLKRLLQKAVPEYQPYLGESD